MLTRMGLCPAMRRSHAASGQERDGAKFETRNIFVRANSAASGQKRDLFLPDRTQVEYVHQGLVSRYRSD